MDDGEVVVAVAVQVGDGDPFMHGTRLVEDRRRQIGRRAGRADRQEQREEDASHRAPFFRKRTPLRHGLEGKGFGAPLYTELIRRTFARGYRHLVGAIALPNEPSVRLHERLGFVKAGHLFRIGCKFDRWIDVGNWQLENGSD